MNEEQNKQMTSGDSITFDYNQLYANQPTAAPQEAVVPEEPVATALQETPIVFEEEKKVEPEVVKNVVPTFDTRALEDVPEDDPSMQKEEQLINTIRPESQQEKDQYKKNLLFIIIFFGILIIAVWFIFPLLAGY